MTRPLYVGVIALLATGLFGEAEAADQQFLRGSRAAVMRAFHIAVREDLSRIKTAKGVARMVARRSLVRIRANEHLTLVGVTHPYARPSMKIFLTRLSAQYHAGCGVPLIVTSLVRPSSKQPANASRFSVHPAGIAVDFRIPNERCRAWLERSLRILEAAKVIEATKERRPPHYHVVVFPKDYRAYVRKKTRTRNRNNTATAMSP